METKNLSAAALFQLIRAHDELRAVLKKQLDDYNSTKMENLGLLAAKVKAGDSIGDEVDDFLALHPGLVANADRHGIPLAGYVRELAEAVSQCQGEPVFVVHAEELGEGSGIRHMSPEAFGSAQAQGFMPPPDFRHWFYTVTCGILNYDKLFFDLQAPAMFVVSDKWRCFKTGEEEITPIDVRRYDAENQELVLPPLKHLIASKYFSKHYRDDWSRGPMTAEVVVGTAAVNAWLDECRDWPLREDLKRWLESALAEKGPDTPPDDGLPPVSDFDVQPAAGSPPISDFGASPFGFGGFPP